MEWSLALGIMFSVATFLVDRAVGWLFGERPMAKAVTIVGERVGVTRKPLVEIRLGRRSRDGDTWRAYLSVENVGLKRASKTDPASNARISLKVEGEDEREMAWEADGYQREINLGRKTQEEVPLIAWSRGEYHWTDRAYWAGKEVQEVQAGLYRLEVQVQWGAGDHVRELFVVDIPGSAVPPEEVYIYREVAGQTKPVKAKQSLPLRIRNYWPASSRKKAHGILIHARLPWDDAIGKPSVTVVDERIRSIWATLDIEVRNLTQHARYLDSLSLEVRSAGFLRKRLGAAGVRSIGATDVSNQHLMWELPPGGVPVRKYVVFSKWWDLGEGPPDSSFFVPSLVLKTADDITLRMEIGRDIMYRQ